MEAILIRLVVSEDPDNAPAGQIGMRIAAHQVPVNTSLVDGTQHLDHFLGIGHPVEAES